MITIKELEDKIEAIDSQIEKIHDDMKIFQEKIEKADSAGKEYINKLQKEMQVYNVTIRENIATLSKLAEEKYKLQGKLELVQDEKSL